MGVTVLGNFGHLQELQILKSVGPSLFVSNPLLQFLDIQAIPLNKTIVRIRNTVTFYNPQPRNWKEKETTCRAIKQRSHRHFELA